MSRVLPLTLSLCITLGTGHPHVIDLFADTFAEQIGYKFDVSKTQIPVFNQNTSFEEIRTNFKLKRDLKSFKKFLLYKGLCYE